MERENTMMQITDIETLRPYADEYPAVTVSALMDGQVRDPVDAFRVFKKMSRQAYILESLEDASRRGRYTFIGYDPKLGIDCKDGVLTIKNGASLRVETDDPGLYIRRILDENRTPRLPDMPPFTGGLVGYFSYDYVCYGEPSLRPAIGRTADEENFRDVDLMLFDKVIAYDHLEHNIRLIVNIRTDFIEENYHRAESELSHIAWLLEYGEPCNMAPLELKSVMRTLYDEARYCSMVERAREYISEGDIFQVVLSNRLDADAEGSLFDAYRMLRRVNPSPYMFYFCSDDLEIAGASPETLVKVNGGEAFTFPLAGTRPRGASPEEDAALERELLADAKECAEHNMLVDLGRNDLGKISEVVRNDETDVGGIRAMKPSRVILSPGPGRPSDAGVCEEVVAALGGEVPVLGVCLGHQAICEAYGAEVSYAKELMHGKASVVSLDTSCPIFAGLPERVRGARYHSLAVSEETIPECLRVTARSEDGEVMAVAHRSLPVYGLQFHPESILTPEGGAIIENFIRGPLTGEGRAI
jgi:anthranilate synthase component 1